MSGSVNEQLYEEMYRVRPELIGIFFAKAREFCAARSGRPCRSLAHFVDDPANESISRELITRIKDGTLLSGDNSAAEAK